MFRAHLPVHCILTGRLAGYKRAGEDHTAILEAGPGDDGSVDPFAAKLNEKKERVAKQKKQEQRNLEEAAGKQHLPGDGNPNSKQAKAQAKAAFKKEQQSEAQRGNLAGEAQALRAISAGDVKGKKEGATDWMSGISKSLEQGKNIKKLRKDRNEMCEVLGRGC